MHANQTSPATPRRSSPIAGVVGATLLIVAADCAATIGLTDDRNLPGPWAQLALRDLEAAREVIRESHPGPVDAQNPDFARWEAEGYKAALEHARAAASLDGYAAAPQRYVGPFRDGHLYMTTTASRQPARWPGVVIASRAGRFVVAYEHAPGNACGVDYVEVRGCSSGPCR